MFLSLFILSFFILAAVAKQPITPRQLALTASGSDTYTCGPGSPCTNGACCGDSGWCGYGETYCGDGCQSNCDAKAECGEFAEDPEASCPLNVCCSEFGFCGTTEEFCKDGCQSNCEQPAPDGSPSNTQERVIGYWEAWNSDRPCGRQSIGEIPVEYLTHLYVSFAYISTDFKITNMDDIATSVYRDVGAVKQRNPNVKLVIALGGWTFSDPGPWQDVFPTMVSTKENRATFIKNLLGFLSYYGYDGVDFDWEYPGADDRGGSEKDGVNYTALLKELQEAISASGRDYIVTFTAPTSYWYLRHFDLKNMEKYVSWINLMSYDLHGVWDSSNPIGNIVLSHTNLTEIDLALDLFWRVDVKPSSIVLGLGFYGRSFKLESASCWKPGCAFDGPGTEGKCTRAAGILSYREIRDILDSTGATAYFDRKAAAKYLVYDTSSWISFDDHETFQLKIDFANKMGLAGLMIWAVDLDDSHLTALKAISDPSNVGAVTRPFDLVDLKNLFPEDLLPPDDTPNQYGLVNFGLNAEAGQTDPTNTGFGFMLVTGESFAVSQLRKRDGLPDPFVFLDCPESVNNRPLDEPQVARVACMSEDVAGCFRVLERGVEGTLVEMPDNCAANRFARAISLNESTDQTFPSGLSNRSPTSSVFDFSFDFNIDLARRDTNKTTIRVDYSNIDGYWKSVVDSPGLQNRDLGGSLDKRYFAPSADDWRDLYRSSQEEEDLNFLPINAVSIKEDMTRSLLWETEKNCEFQGEEYEHGFGAYIEGNIDATFYYGFSLIATVEDGFEVHQANGIIQIGGQTDLNYVIGGIGDVDIDKANQGNPAIFEEKPHELEGHVVTAGAASLTITPYYQFMWQFATFGDLSGGSGTVNTTATFNGMGNTRIISDLGNITANFPVKDLDIGSQNDNRDKNKISINRDDNFIYSTNDEGSRIAVGTYVVLGLKVSLDLQDRSGSRTIDLPDMSLNWNTMTEFSFIPGDDGEVCTEYSVMTNVFQMAENAESVGWDEQQLASLVVDGQEPEDGKFCSTSDWPDDGDDSTRQGKRQSGPPGQIPYWALKPGNQLEVEYIFKDDDVNNFMGVGKEVFKGGNCVECLDEEFGKCCGCTCMDIAFPYFRDIGECESCNRPEGLWPWSTFFVPGPGRGLAGDDDPDWYLKQGTPTEEVEDAALVVPEPRASGTATISQKKVSACGQKLAATEKYRYPAFPADARWPWDGIQNNRWDDISRYWHNVSASCSNWTVGKFSDPDYHYPAGIRVRANYQTEHVFEGQLVGDFFTLWLAQGAVAGGSPGTSKLSCAFTKDWITKIKRASDGDFPWLQGNTGTSFFQYLLQELGSETHMDRLTIYPARPNQKKGAIFSGNQPTSEDKWTEMDGEEQLQSVKEMGMTFSYMNHPDVVKAFCKTYEGIYDKLEFFHDYWDVEGDDDEIPDLQKEWKNYIRASLDAVVERSSDTFWWMYANAYDLDDPVIAEHWVENVSANVDRIHLNDVTCDNLPGPSR